MLDPTRESGDTLKGPSRERLIRLRDDLLVFVHREREAQKAHYHKVWRQPIADRMRQGRCVTNLFLEQIIENRILHFRVQENDSDFREGDRVRISHGDPLDGICDGEFYREENEFIQVILDRPGDWQPREHNTRFTLDHSFFDLQSFYTQAIDRLQDTEIGRNRILPLLASDREPSSDFELFEVTRQQSLGNGLNESQAEAIAGATSTDLCHLIQGPPGTGKTHVLAQIVRNRLALGERILVTAFTHRAIHNALNKIEALCPAKVCKIGRPFFDPDLKVPQFERFDLSPFNGVGGEYVIGATPFAALKRLSGVEFDTVIFDEAGQITLPLAVMAMLSGKTYIFIGDHKQLPPIVQSADDGEESDHSIFKFLRGRGFDDALAVTYRMNQEVTRWPSEHFYSGELTPHETVANRRIHYPGQGLQFDDILDPSHPVTFVETGPGEDRSSSLDQAILIRDLIEELIIGRQLKPSEIAVVVPFRRQSRLIRHHLRLRPQLAGHLADIVIDTVERMQGQEREIIILAMTASDPVYIGQIEAFLFHPNRLNVAVTRARSKLIILGSTSLLSPDPSFHSAGLPETSERLELFRSLAASAKTIKLVHG